MNPRATLLSLCCTLPLLAQEAKPQPDAEVRKARQAVVDELAKQGVALDFDKKTLTIDVVVNQPADPLEYLLIHPRGKGHEALFVTEVLPSVLNSALLVLGFKEGKNADMKEKNPMPTEAEIEAGAEPYELIHAEGMPLYLTTRWRDGDQEREVPVADLIVDLTTQKPLRDETWIYLGGRMHALYRGEAPVFVGDYEGNIVSVCYLRPANHLVTMRHERAPDDQNWWKTELCPPVETKMQLIFHVDEPAIVKARRERLAAEDKQAGEGSKGAPASGTGKDRDGL